MNLRYYVYVSDTKIDMLFDQIPKGILTKFAGELSVNVGFVSASLKKGSEDKTRYAKLEIVKRYIEESEEIGTVDLPAAYFADSLPMRWGPYPSEKSLVYFGGSTDKTVVGLGGSSHHVIGGSGTAEVGQSMSLTPLLVSILCKAADLPEPDLNRRHREHLGFFEGGHRDNPNYALEAIWFATDGMYGPQQRVEFLAKRLVHGEAKGKRVLLGTPLYVSIAD